MSLDHDQVLADIEQRVRTHGARLDEVDCRIAEELGVPHVYYFAYLLVWGAIEAYREARALTDPARTPADVVAVGDAAGRCQSLADSIGWLASTIYQQAVDLGPLGQELAGHAARILGAVLQLRQNLRDLDAALYGPRAQLGGNGTGEGVRS